MLSKNRLSPTKYNVDTNGSRMLRRSSKKRGRNFCIPSQDRSFDKRNGGKSIDRTLEEERMVWQQELTGIVASYNSLAADYNAEMSKWNYRFANVGKLPAGARE